MNATAAKLNTEGIVPAVHLEFIHNQLENPQDAGPQEIEQYHRALFLHHHAVEWERHRQQAKIHEERLAFLEGQLKNADAALSERKQLVPVTIDGEEDTKPAAPWNAWDILMFAVCGVGIVCLITFGVWNISFNLLESGLITFRENRLGLSAGSQAARSLFVGLPLARDDRRDHLGRRLCLGLSDTIEGHQRAHRVAHRV